MGQTPAKILRLGRGSETKRVLCYGDSNTAGFFAGGSGFSPYANSLQEALEAQGCDCEVTHCGLSGLTAEELLAKQGAPAIRDVCGSVGKGLACMLSEAPQDLVLIMLGTNDLGKGTHPEHIAQYVSEMHSICHSFETPTLSLAPPTVLHGPPRSSREYLATRLVQNAGVVSEIFDHRDAEDLVPRSSASLWEPDGLHFAPAGSCQFGYSLAPVVQDVMRSSVGTFRLRPGQMVEFFSDKLQRYVRREVHHVERGAVVLKGEDAPILQSQWRSMIRPAKSEVEETSPESFKGSEPGASAQTSARPCGVTGCGRKAAGKYPTCCRTCNKTGGAEHGPRCEAAYGCRPATGSKQARFQKGQQAEYYSTSNGMWIPCIVTRVDAVSSAVELDVKPGNWMDLKEQEQRLRPKASSGACKYAMGQQLHLYSVSKKMWTLCEVINIDSKTGNIEVDAKKGYWFTPQEQAERIREVQNQQASEKGAGPAGRASAFTGFAIGEEYEYFSKSKGMWVKCKITHVEPNGAIQIDVKKGVSISLEEQAENIRMPREDFRHYSVVMNPRAV